MRHKKHKMCSDNTSNNCYSEQVGILYRANFVKAASDDSFFDAKIIQKTVCCSQTVKVLFTESQAE